MTLKFLEGHSGRFFNEPTLMNRFFLSLFLAFVFACNATAAERPAEWAQPISLSGAPNLHQITPNIFRSAQPSSLGMRNLEKRGIRTVISLRNNHDDTELLSGTRLRAIQVPVNTWDIRDEQVVATLQALKHTENGPFLLHCQHGADRTGLISAMYRIVVQGWDKKQALEELTAGGLGYHAMWTNIPRYIKNVDIERIRRLVDTPHD